MNWFLVLSLESGLPVYYRTFNHAQFDATPSAEERDVMHISSMLYALRKVSSTLENPANLNRGKHRIGQLHHMQQVR